jgi:hypothetical protein
MIKGAVMENLPNLRGPKPKYDWRLVAQLLSEGKSTTEIGTILGCSRQTVWRFMRKSASLRDRSGELRRRDRAEIGARLLGLRAMMIETIHQAIADGDKQMTRWLADRLGLHKFEALEAVASLDEPGVEQLDAEAILDHVPTPVEIENAARTMAAAEADVAVAAEAVAVTHEELQGDKPATVSLRNALSRAEVVVTRNAVWPPPGVFAE